MAFSIGTAIKIGSSALGMLSKKKANAPMTPLQLAARNLATQPYPTSSIGTPGRQKQEVQEDPENRQKHMITIEWLQQLN